MNKEELATKVSNPITSTDSWYDANEDNLPDTLEIEGEVDNILTLSQEEYNRYVFDVMDLDRNNVASWNNRSNPNKKGWVNSICRR